MDTTIEMVLKNGGPLAVLVAVVWIFVKDRREGSKEHRQWMTDTLKSNHEWISAMHAEHLDARSQMRDTISQNTQALLSANMERAKNTDAISALTFSIGKPPIHPKQ